MLIALGIIAGSVIGYAMAGVQGAIAGAFSGWIIALALRSRKQLQAREPRNAAAPQGFDASSVPPQPDAPRPPAAPAPPPTPQAASVWMAPTVAAAPLPASAPLTLAERLTAIEARLARIEAGMVPAAPPAAATRADEPGTGFARRPDGTFEPVAPAPAVVVRAAAANPASGRATVPPAAPNPVWAWITGGNLLTRVGVVVLFFGVAFLLRYFAEMITIPIEAKLAGVALAGVAFIGVGMRLAPTRPGYGISLAGAGAGILYLTTYAALRLYDVLPPAVAFALFVAIAVVTVGLAVRTDAQPLAGLAIAGGFLAPFLVSTSTPSPAMLFGYFAVLNAAIFVLAWMRRWRALNVLGFVFTFMFGLFWGHQYYQPPYFATVEPFLVLFFLFYVAIAVLYAARAPLQTQAPVDGLLVFGVPLLGFALQTGLVQDFRYGAAISAFTVAAFYGALALALWRRSEPGLALLGRAFLVLAIIFATIGIPYAVDARWTSAWWALEAAGVYWIGCRQRQGIARTFALLLQLGAAMAFATDLLRESERMFVNANFMGAALIACAALVTAWLADRYRDRVSSLERAAVPFMLLWGLLWWYGGAARELEQGLSTRSLPNAMLAFVTGTVAVALLVHRWLRWSRLPWFGAALLPAMLLAGIHDWQRMHTTLLAWGALVWPLAWTVHWLALRAADGALYGENPAVEPFPRSVEWLKHAHTASAIALVGWLSWEASEWVGRWFAEGTVWMACAAAWPAILYLALAPRTVAWRGWPWSGYRDAYAVSAAMAIAALLAVWFVLVNVVSPGGAAPLPYVPLANPLDCTLIAALLVLFTWLRATDTLDETQSWGWLGVAVFLLINAIVFRTVHQWLNVPWRLHVLLQSTTLQAALTLMWTATALPLMVLANKRAVRPLWMIGAALLAIVVGKLFLVDLAALSGLSRVVAFLGVGALLLVIGYLAPLPPAARRRG